jgi:hypothetical protein
VGSEDVYKRQNVELPAKKNTININLTNNFITIDLGCVVNIFLQ